MRRCSCGTDTSVSIVSHFIGCVSCDQTIASPAAYCLLVFTSCSNIVLHLRLLSLCRLLLASPWAVHDLLTVSLRAVKTQQIIFEAYSTQQGNSITPSSDSPHKQQRDEGHTFACRQTLSCYANHVVLLCKPLLSTASMALSSTPSTSDP